jgi:hypothetical protein
MQAPFDATPLWRLAQARLFARSTRLWLAQGDIPARRIRVGDCWEVLGRRFVQDDISVFIVGSGCEGRSFATPWRRTMSNARR